MNTPKERGSKDGFNHCLKVMSGEQGRHQINNYPSNPYPRGSKEWGKYNRAFEQGYKEPLNLMAQP